MAGLLAEAFVAIHAEGAQLPAEVEAQASAAATAAEAILAEGIAAGGVAGGEAAGAGIAAGVSTGAAEAGTVAGEELVASMAEAGTVAGAAAGAAIAPPLVEESAVAGREAGTAFGEQFAAVSGEVGGMAGGLLAKGMTGALTAAIGVGVVVHELSSFVTAARETGGASRALSASLISNAEAAAVPIPVYKAHAAALQDLTGFQDEQILKSEAQLIQFGLTGDQVKELTPLILDYAARTGKDVPAASSAAAKALLGTGRALKEVGIKFKDAGSLAANYDQLVEGLTRTVGGYAQAQMSGLAGQSRLLSANIQDLKSNLGNDLIPYLVLGTKAANELTGGLADSSQETSGLGKAISYTNPILLGLRAGFSIVHAGANLLRGDTDEVAAALSDATEAVGDNAKALNEGKMSVDDFRAAYKEEAESVKAAGGSATDYHAILNEGHGAIIAYREQLTGLTTARQVDTAAALQEQLAQAQLAGGFAGVAAGLVSERNARNALAEAQAKVNRLRARGKEDTDKYREANTALLGAEASLITTHGGLVKNLGDLLIAQNKQGASAAEVKQEVKEQGEAAGATKDQVKDLTDQVVHYIRKQGEIKDSVVTEYAAPGLHEALLDADALQAKFAALDTMGGFGSTSPAGGGGKHHGGQGSGGSDVPGTGVDRNPGRVVAEVYLDKQLISTQADQTVDLLSGG